MGPFDSREIAIAIWAVFLAAWILFSARRSSAPGRLLKAVAQNQILTALALMTLYIAVIVFGLRAVGLWDIGQLKNTIIWSLFVAPVSLFRINSIADDPHHYRNAIKDNLGLVAVLEFIIAYRTFDLWVELLIVPVTAVLAAMLALAESRKEHANVAHLLNSLLALFGLGLIVHAAYGLITDFRSFATMQTLSDFYLAPVLSLLFLPFLFLLALYVSYENAFTSLRFSLKNPALESYAKRRAFLGFYVHTRLLKRWRRNLNITKPQSRREIDDSIREVKALWARESNPPDVPYESGWSPYHACKFLMTEGLQPGDYHKGFEGWWASSPYLEAGDKAIVRNNIAYYIEGGKFAATTLKLVLNVNDPQSTKEARERFISMAQMLFECALGNAMPDDIERQLRSETATVLNLHSKEIIIVKDLWPGHRLGGYELNFIIQNAGSGA